jgi:hypothetical protein
VLAKYELNINAIESFVVGVDAEAQHTLRPFCCIVIHGLFNQPTCGVLHFVFVVRLQTAQHSFCCFKPAARKSMSVLILLVSTPCQPPLLQEQELAR